MSIYSLFGLADFLVIIIIKHSIVLQVDHDLHHFVDRSLDDSFYLTSIFVSVVDVLFVLS